ncbi:MAG: D-alanine--D-alanine ligase [Dehalococcoidia bacterium]|nr:MAG: D-alanine--D-alanine ligase [Dehalococcoidia bacterium]
MRLGLAYDLKEAVAASTGTDDALEEYDSLETVDRLAKFLEADGHEVVMLGGGKEFLRKILIEKVDFVFNIAEGQGNYRSREAQVPAVLEMLGIPYSGSDPLCLAICLDKPLTKQLIAAARVKTPGWLSVRGYDDITRIATSDLVYPAIIKPACEGSSKGVKLGSVVAGAVEAAAVAGKLLHQYRQPVLVEEFIRGTEVTIGIVGNDPPEVVGMMAVVPKQNEPDFVYSLEVKRNYLELVDYQCPADLAPEVLKRLEASAIAVFKTLGCRDFARIDYRVSAGGTPYFLEINPLPGLGDYSDLVIMAEMTGLGHRGLVARVLGAAFGRYPQCVAA